MFNSTKLHKELEQAGIPIYGCNSNGEIDFKPEVTQEQINQAVIIKQNHTELWYVEERRKRYPDFGDQLDYLYKIFKKMKNDGVNIGIDGDEWLAKIDKIKSDWPKV